MSFILMMRKSMLLITFAMVCALPGFAQLPQVPSEAQEDDNTVADVFVGGSVQGSGHTGGWIASGAVHVNEEFSLVAEAGAQYAAVIDVFGGEDRLSLFTVAGGPRVQFTMNKKFIPFVQATVGEMRVSLNVSGIPADNGFLFSPGGGADFMISRRVGWRIGQVDYRLFWLDGVCASAWRYSTGITFRF